jgi:hypothetical protein
MHFFDFILSFIEILHHIFELHFYSLLIVDELIILINQFLYLYKKIRYLII